jgi:hypothetical protein
VTARDSAPRSLKSLDVVGEAVQPLRAASPRTRRWGPVAVTGGLLLAGSTVPLPPGVDPDFGPYGPDRFLHLVGHAGFTATLLAALEDGATVDRGRASLAIVSSVGYGVCTELMQEGIPGRGFERGDVVAGFVGSVLGVLVARCVSERP